MSALGLRARSAPPPRVDWTGAEIRRARKLWEGRAGREASEDEVIGTILAVEYANVPAELRGAQRAAAKATIAELLWWQVLAQIEPGRYRWADEFPEWPTRTYAEVQARDAKLREREREDEQERRVQEQAEQRERTNPNRGLEGRIAAVEDQLREMQRAIASPARRRDGEQTIARLDELTAQRKAAHQGRDQTDPPDHAGEENHEHTTDKSRD